MNFNLNVLAKLQNSALAHYASRGWYWTNRIGKLNIVTVAAVWYVCGERYRNIMKSAMAG